MASPRAVTFDFGQTLCELDAQMLARRLRERDIAVSAEAVDASIAEAWHAYEAGIAKGLGGHPWKVFMARLLTLSGVPETEVSPAVDWLWTEQPRRNLWRRPIAGMIELCRELARQGLGVGIISNSEGALAELLEEIGWGADFAVVADSGKLGIDKPDPAIFRFAADALKVPVEGIVHVGDSWGADIDGALRAGMRAIWFRGRSGTDLPPAVRRAEDAGGVRAALGRWLEHRTG
jgi:FMN hydrolase / 5-amino-6-(5-phospho-D-ribitylamino)uracil phosphatase